MNISFPTFVKCVLLWIPVLLLFPLLLILLIFLAVYKIVVIILSKLLRKGDIIRPVKGLDVLFSTDKLYKRPYGNVGFVWIVDGSLSPEVIKSRLQNALLAPATGTKVEEGFEKLTCVVPEFWMGFPFWRKARPFDITNHVKVKEPNCERFIQANDINKMICELMLEPFTQGCPLWEILLLPDISFASKILPDLLWPSSVVPMPSEETHHLKKHRDGKQKVKSILIMKAHHILGDGYSMTALLSKILDSPPPNKVQVQQPSTGNKAEKVFHTDHHQQNRIISNVAHGTWCKLSTALELTFLVPLTLASLVYQFGIHRDSWFTTPKQSDNLNWATVCISMDRLSEIRKDLCTTLDDYAPTTRHSVAHYDGNSCRNNRDRRGSNSKNAHPLRVPVVVIVVAALAGALRKLLTIPASMKMEKVEKKLHKRKSKDYSECNDDYVCGTKSVTGITTEYIPSSTNFVISLPLQKGHPGNTTFGNFWTHGILSANMKEINSRRRLSLLNNSYWEMQRLGMPEIYHSLVQLFAIFPEPILRLISSFNMGASIGVTNLVGPTNCAFIGGQRVTHKYGYFGLLWRHASLTLASFSYNGQLNISVLANRSVIEDEESLQKLLTQHLLLELNSFVKLKESELDSPFSVIGPL